MFYNLCQLYQPQPILVNLVAASQKSTRDFCLRLLCATFVAHTARVKQLSSTIRHSNILIVAMTVVVF